MSDEPDNLTLRYLRRIEGKLDRLIEDVADLDRRMTSLEATVARLHAWFAQQRDRSSAPA